MLMSLFIFITLLHWSNMSRDGFQELPLVSLSEVEKRTERYHFLLGLRSSSTDLLKSLAWLYRHENSLVVGVYDDTNDDTPIPWDKTVKEFDRETARLIFFERAVKERNCLLSVDLKKPMKAAAIVKDSLDDVIEFVNERCFYFVDIRDELSTAGKERLRILQNMYRVPKPGRQKTECERINLPKDSRDFVQNYLFRSKPVIIENAMLHWEALSKWTNDFLRAKYADVKVHVKLTPNGDFEGCDQTSKFENFDSFRIPDAVKSKLQYPDLAVVRPAVGNMHFGEFLDLIEIKDNKNISAYLEYSSIRDYFSELEDDVHEMPFISDVLKLSHLNIWLSNGNTLGKLHFDPFDNFLCQLRGNKRLTIFDPHNNYNLYEAHIQEALLHFDKKTQQFRNKQLLDSTSMVMSPIDILKPNIDRFPNFTRAHAMECYLNEGDVLYIPSFWWHEVQSYPNPIEKRNLAVNFWYEPFLTKEFPCPECKMDVNRMYRNLLGKKHLRDRKRRKVVKTNKERLEI